MNRLLKINKVYLLQSLQKRADTTTIWRVSSSLLENEGPYSFILHDSKGCAPLRECLQKCMIPLCWKTCFPFTFKSIIKTRRVCYWKYEESKIVLVEKINKRESQDKEHPIKKHQAQHIRQSEASLLRQMPVNLSEAALFWIFQPQEIVWSTGRQQHWRLRIPGRVSGI